MSKTYKFTSLNLKFKSAQAVHFEGFKARKHLAVSNKILFLYIHLHIVYAKLQDVSVTSCGTSCIFKILRKNQSFTDGRTNQNGPHLKPKRNEKKKDNKQCLSDTPRNQ